MLFRFIKPALLISGGFFIALIQGCSSVPLQSDLLLEKKPAEFIEPVELVETPFFPQREYHCGPAALATLFNSKQVNKFPDELVPYIYVPERKGSFQVELLAETRKAELIPFVIEKNIQSLLSEIKAGNPVLVLQNLGLASFPKWHYAVVIGYDMLNDKIILRSGEYKRHINSFSLFERTWQRAKYWGFIVLRPGELPASNNAFLYLKSVAAFEQLGKKEIAYKAYLTGLKKWPEDVYLLMAAGNTSYNLGKTEQAIEYYQRVLNIKPGYAPALNNYAQVLISQDKLQQAEKIILQAISNNDRHAGKYKKTLNEIKQKRQQK